MLEFQRLEKLVFGGLRGRVYTEQVSKLHKEFLHLCKAIRDQEYNPLDLTSQVWLLGINSKDTLLETSCRLNIFCLQNRFNSVLVMCWNCSSQILAHIDMITSYCLFRFVGCTTMMPMSCFPISYISVLLNWDLVSVGSFEYNVYATENIDICIEMF